MQNVCITVVIFFFICFSFSVGLCCGWIRETGWIWAYQFNNSMYTDLFCCFFFSSQFTSIIWMKWDVANFKRTIHCWIHIYQDSSWAHYHNMYMSGESGAKHFVFVIRFWEKLVANPNLTKWNSNPYGCVHVDLNLIVSYAMNLMNLRFVGFFTLQKTCHIK